MVMWLNEVQNLLSFEEVVVKGVHVNINSSGCSGEEAGPLPGKEKTSSKPKQVSDLIRSVGHW